MGRTRAGGVNGEGSGADGVNGEMDMSGADGKQRGMGINGRCELSSCNGGDWWCRTNHWNHGGKDTCGGFRE